MRQTSIPYGKGAIVAELPAEYAVEIVQPRLQAAAADPAALARDAVYNPLGAVKPPRAGQTVAIAINDKTRPVPHEHLLPPVLTGMRHAGVRDEDVLFIIATGTHPRMAPAEYSAILPRDILETYRVVCHDAGDEANLTHLGRDRARHAGLYQQRLLGRRLSHRASAISSRISFKAFPAGSKAPPSAWPACRTINHNHAMMRDA